MCIPLINVMSQVLGFKIGEKCLGLFVAMCCLFGLFFVHYCVRILQVRLQHIVENLQHLDLFFFS